MDSSARLGESHPRYRALPFELQHVVRDATHTLVLKGELDLAARPALDAALAQICRDGIKTVVLDLGKLTFMDTTGIRMLLEAKELCTENGREFFVVRGQEQVQRVLEITGLLDELAFRTNGAATRRPAS